MERFSFIFLVAGIVLFVFAFLTLALAPWLSLRNVDVVEVMPEEVPAEFATYYETPDEYRTALDEGRKIYIKEACWHCHSQFVRPISNESIRYGPVSTSGEYENDLQLPQLFGTRRVGPDLFREHGKHTNDWHFAHFYEPQNVVPHSVMPPFKWYFNEDKSPKPEMVALVAYVQWLGSWIDLDVETIYNTGQ